MDLNQKAKDLEKYKRKEFDRARKTNSFYIDFNPKKMDSFNSKEWMIGKKLSRKTGFKNAIYAKFRILRKIQKWSLEDARFSAIVYKPSDVS